jgi:hypothetical protein
MGLCEECRFDTQGFCLECGLMCEGPLLVDTPDWMVGEDAPRCTRIVYQRWSEEKQVARMEAILSERCCDLVKDSAETTVWLRKAPLRPNMRLREVLGICGAALLLHDCSLDVKKVVSAVQTSTHFVNVGLRNLRAGVDEGMGAWGKRVERMMQEAGLDGHHGLSVSLCKKAHAIRRRLPGMVPKSIACYSGWLCLKSSDSLLLSRAEFCKAVKISPVTLDNADRLFRENASPRKSRAPPPLLPQGPVNKVIARMRTHVPKEDEAKKAQELFQRCTSEPSHPPQIALAAACVAWCTPKASVRDVAATGLTSAPSVRALLKSYLPRFSTD